MIYKQAPHALTGLALLLFLSTGCSGGSESGSPLGVNPGDSNIPAAPDTFDDEPYIREVTGITTGTSNINGAVTIVPGFENQPANRVMGASAGELIFFRLKTTMSDGSTNLNNASSYAGPTFDYNYSTNSPGGETSYEARYVINSEPITLSLWNADAPQGELHGPAVAWDYMIKTAPADTQEEPNSDNDTNSVFDRTMANPLAMNVVTNRSMYSFSLTKLDVEEWYKVNLTAGLIYTIDVGTYHPRYGTWKYRVHVRNPDTTINTAGLMYIEPEQTSGKLVVTAPVTGTYYIQMAGYRRTRTESGNVYFSPYSIKIAPIVAP